MIRPPSDSHSRFPDPGDGGLDGEDNAALEAYLARFFAAPTPAGLRSRIVAESNRYRREQHDPGSDQPERLVETAATAHPEEEPMRTVIPTPVLAFPGRQPRWTAQSGRTDRQQTTAPSRGVRRVGRDSLGLVASLALIVLIALSAVAVYDGSPGGEEPTAFLGAGASTPTPSADDRTADAAVADPVYGTTEDGTEYVRVPYGDCTEVEPIAFDDAMEMTIGDAYPFEGFPPPVEIAKRQASAGSTAQWTFSTLPAGRPVDAETIAAVVDTYGLYRGCEDTKLRQARTLTPEGFARDVFLTPSRYLIDDVQPDGGQLVALWFDGQGRQSNDSDHFGKLTDAYLYDFRLLPSGEVIAFLSGRQVGAEPDALPTFYENAGYVLFAEQDGQWLIDEHF